MDTRPFLYHFDRSEFRQWWHVMDPRLLVVLDICRAAWGAPFRISPVNGALGRRLGKDSTSQHNIERWGEVRAADVFPEGLDNQLDAARMLGIARRSGVTGIGIYPNWRPSCGIHFDVRRDAKPGNPVTWGGVDSGSGQRYVSWDAACDKLPLGAK